MSGETSELEAIAGRLRELAARLREGGLGEEEAVELAREAAELSARAGAAVEVALHEREERSATEAEPDVPA